MIITNNATCPAGNSQQYLISFRQGSPDYMQRNTAPGHTLRREGYNDAIILK